MATALKFELGGKTFEAVPVKLERKKLYGYTDVVATDSEGNVCQAARLAPDGTLIVPPGGAKAGMLTEKGEWMERSELKSVDADGNELSTVPSSFGQVIALTREADEEEFLDHLWKSVYQLANPELAAAIGNKIFAFDFSYRASVSADEGYLLAANGIAYLFSGERILREFIGLVETATLEDEPEEENLEEDDFDFSMM